MKNSIPTVVKEKAQELIEMYGDRLEYKGIYNTQEVYEFCFPKEKEIGFPQLYLLKSLDANVKEVVGYEALKVLRILRG